MIRVLFSAIALLISTQALALLPPSLPVPLPALPTGHIPLAMPAPPTLQMPSNSGLASAISQLRTTVPTLIPRVVALDAMSSPNFRALIDTLGSSLPPAGIQALSRELAAKLQPVQCLVNSDSTTLAFADMPTSAPADSHSLTNGLVITCDANAKITLSTSQPFASQLIDNASFRSNQWNLRVSDSGSTAPAQISLFMADGSPAHQKTLSIVANTPTPIALKVLLHDVLDATSTPAQSGALEASKPLMLYIVTTRAGT